MRAHSSFGLALLFVSITGCPSATTPPAVDAASADTGAADAVANDAGTGSDAGAADADVRDAATLDAGAARFTVELVDPYAYGNCFMGPPDPLMVGWNARVVGPAGDVITLTQATLHIAVPAESYSEDQAITVEVPSFAIPAGGTIDQEQRKASGTPSIPICTFCDAEVIEAALSVTYTSSGGGAVTVEATLEGTGCVF